MNRGGIFIAATVGIERRQSSQRSPRPQRSSGADIDSGTSRQASCR